MSILMVQCILESPLSLSGTMDLALLIRLLVENYQPQPLMVTCLPILHEATLL